MPESIFIRLEGGETKGPLGQDIFDQLLASGLISQEIQVKRENDAQWMSLQEFMRPAGEAPTLACAGCGAQTQTENTFCPRCGARLKQGPEPQEHRQGSAGASGRPSPDGEACPPPVPGPHTPQATPGDPAAIPSEGSSLKFKTKRNLIRTIFGGIIVFFLMPFMTVTCGTAKVLTLSGVELATGKEVRIPNPVVDRVESKRIEPNGYAVLAGLAAIAGFVLAFAPYRNSKSSNRVCAVVGLVATLGLKLFFEGRVTEGGEGMIRLDWEIGFWLTLMGFIAAGVLSFLPSDDDPREDQPEPSSARP